MDTMKPRHLNSSDRVNLFVQNLPFSVVSVGHVASDLQTLVVLETIIDVLCVGHDLVGNADLFEKIHYIGAQTNRGTWFFLRSTPNDEKLIVRMHRGCTRSMNEEFWGCRDWFHKGLDVYVIVKNTEMGHKKKTYPGVPLFSRAQRPHT